MILRGRVWTFGEDVDTDAIIPGKYLIMTDPQELGRHCMEGISPDLWQKVKAGDVMVAGKNFGCGSSREHAPIAIKAVGISCVIAESFARIFYRNAFNIGLPLLQCASCTSRLKEGHEIEVDLDAGQIRNIVNGEVFATKPVPPFMQELIKDGGLMKHLAKQLKN